MRELASAAGRFQISEVVSTRDEFVMRHPNTSVCAEVLSWSGEPELLQSEAAARKLDANRFEDLAKANGFVCMDEEALANCWMATIWLHETRKRCGSGVEEQARGVSAKN